MTPAPPSILAWTRAAVRPAPASFGPTLPPAPSVAVAAAHVGGEDGLAPIGVAGSDRRHGACRRVRRQKLPLRDGEHGAGDAYERRHGSPQPSIHQNPNRTFVKYQRLDVTHSTSSVAASTPPATGNDPLRIAILPARGPVVLADHEHLGDEHAVHEGSCDRVDGNAGIGRLEAEQEARSGRTRGACRESPAAPTSDAPAWQRGTRAARRAGAGPTCGMR